MSCGNKSGSINKTIIVEPLSLTGGAPTITACTSIFTNKIETCSGDTSIILNSGETIFNKNIVPNTDNTISIGGQTRRFRDLNTVSGTTTVWTATNRVDTPQLNLGLDSSGNSRVITADNSVIQNDILNGGTF